MTVCCDYPTSLSKYVGETVPLDFEFALKLGSNATWTINSVTSIVAAPIGLDVGVSMNWAIEGTRVQTKVSGGDVDVEYTVTCNVAAQDSNGRILALSLPCFMLVEGLPG